MAASPFSVVRWFIRYPQHRKMLAERAAANSREVEKAYGAQMSGAYQIISSYTAAKVKAIFSQMTKRTVGMDLGLEIREKDEQKSMRKNMRARSSWLLSRWWKTLILKFSYMALHSRSLIQMIPNRRKRSNLRNRPGMSKRYPQL